jgi:hypothetical protein
MPMSVLSDFRQIGARKAYVAHGESRDDEGQEARSVDERPGVVCGRMEGTTRMSMDLNPNSERGSCEFLPERGEPSRVQLEANSVSVVRGVDNRSNGLWLGPRTYP